MTRSRRQVVAVALCLSLVMVACGNSKSDSSNAPTGGGGGASSPKDGGEKSRNVKKDISGVPGVSSDTISYAVIGTKQGNPLGTCILDCYVDGIKAHFAYRNSQGGIYGRKLAIDTPVDDQLGSNQARAIDVVSQKKDFGVFEATLLQSGWGDLDTAGVPAYVWGIAAPDSVNRSHNFPSTVVRCPDCTRRYYSYLANKAGATKAAALGYGTSENSKVCSNAINDSFKLYEKDTGVKSVYLNDSLAFGAPNGFGPEVTAMRKAGVEFIATCLDLNAMKTLAQELKRQGMSDVVLMHPNTYDQNFVKKNKDLFDRDDVIPQFIPFEAQAKGTALADFKKWMAKQGSDLTELAMTGWINASLAYEGLLAAGPAFDREKVTAATNRITDFSAGGLLRPINWTTAHTPYTQATRKGETEPCTAPVVVKNGQFKTLAPADKPWLCWKGTGTTWSEPVPTSSK